MELKIVTTKDHSTTVYHPELDEHYHSLHGAVAESRHVFIEAGLKPMLQKEARLSILEVGFGTGLNALLTLLEVENSEIQIYYQGLEPFPLQQNVLQQIELPDLFSNSMFKQQFQEIHAVGWEEPLAIARNFELHKSLHGIEAKKFSKIFNLVYFDAFAPQKIPNLWSEEVFAKLYGCLAPQGILVTYSAAGMVKRNLRSAGFKVERLPGASGKHHMLRAIRV